MLENDDNCCTNQQIGTAEHLSSTEYIVSVF